MKLMDALIEQGPSLELQRAAHVELCRLEGELARIRNQLRQLPKRGALGGRSCVWYVDVMNVVGGQPAEEPKEIEDELQRD